MTLNWVCYMKISVIVPVYNVEKSLEKCLDSLINQTLKELEIICINDGSTDSSVDILNQYAKKDARIKIIDQPNLGVSAARNAGMRIASGKYIGFVDSDDWIDVDYFGRLYNAAEKHGADIACCSILRAYSGGKLKTKLKIKEEAIYTNAAEKFKKLEIPRKCYVYNKIYLREKLQQLNLNFKEGVYFEDIGFTIRALYHMQTVATVPGPTYYYRVNTQSITRQMTDRKQQDLLAAREDFLEFAQKHHLYDCGEKWYILRKIFYNFMGIPVMKIHEWKTIKKYYLFGLIKVFEKRISL